ncbi:MAG: hypothetical protein PUB07_00790 [Clostridia bacterium]|nr:hypothetical protein [Clostridia bacterium]
MKKLAVCSLLAILVLSVSLGCLAAPEVISAYDGGTTYGLMTVKKPETSVSSTTKQNYTLSAICRSGVVVSLYSYNSATGQFYLKRDAWGNPLTKTVSASGTYLQEVDLAKETNYLLLRAEYGDGNYQHVRLDITLLDQALLDSIRGFAANFRSIFGGW